MGRENPKYKSLKEFKRDIILYKELLDAYIDLNSNVMFKLFYGSCLNDYVNNDTDIPKYQPKNNSSRLLVKYPLFLGQMGILYKLDPAKYSGKLNDALLEFLAFNFRKNVVFIINNEGFLLYVILAQITRQQIIMTNVFFSEHIDDLTSFQFLSREYNPELEPFKPITPKYRTAVKQEDVFMVFF
jgi:hypothetical protein